MCKLLKSETRSVNSPVSQLLAAIVLCALAAGGIGTIVNQWLIGWMIIVGLAAVCLSFMAIGAMTLATRLPLLENTSILNDHRRTADVDPLNTDDASHSHVSAQDASETLKALQSRGNDQGQCICRRSSGIQQSV